MRSNAANWKCQGFLLFNHHVAQIWCSFSLLITVVSGVLYVFYNAEAFLNGKLPKLCAMLHLYMQSTMKKPADSPSFVLYFMQMWFDWNGRDYSVGWRSQCPSVSWPLWASSIQCWSMAVILAVWWPLSCQSCFESPSQVDTVGRSNSAENGTKICIRVPCVCWHTMFLWAALGALLWAPNWHHLGWWNLQCCCRFWDNFHALFSYVAFRDICKYLVQHCGFPEVTSR